MGFVLVPAKALLEALAEFERSQRVNPEYALIDHMQNVLAEVWPEQQQHLRPLELLDPNDDEAMDWVTKNLSAVRRDNGSLEYGLTAVVRAYQAGKASIETKKENY
jgi:hypothetical protein